MVMINLHATPLVLTQDFPQGWFITACYKPGRCGVLEVFTFDQLELVPYDKRIEAHFLNVEVYTAAQEPSNYNRKIPFLKRTTKETFLPYLEDEVIILETNNNARFISPKSIYSHDSAHQRFAFTFDTTPFMVVTTHREELLETLERTLIQIGVPLLDLDMVRSEVLAKLAL